MKRFAAVFAVVLLAVLASNQMLAQPNTANYTYATTTTGSLVDMSSGTTTLLNGAGDDVASSVTNIGFDFYFMGTRYTQFSANTNGGVQLGASGITGTRRGNDFPVISTPLIAPWLGDLNCRSTNSSLVRYKVIGSAPNRTLVIEFTNMSQDFTSTTADDNFQCLLSETTGEIEFRYGAMAVGAAGATNTFRIVAVGFASSTGDGNFVTVDQATLAANTTGTPAKTDYTTAQALPNFSSTTDGSRRTIKFTPPAPAAPSNLTFTAITSSGMTLNWNDNSSNEVAFHIYRSLDGVNYTLVATTAPNATSSIQSGLTPGTTYFWQVYAVSEGGISTALSGSQATSPPGSVVSNGTGGGNWSSTATWVGGVVPTSGDNVTIANGDVVTLDAAGLACNTLTVGGGTSGTLQYQATPLAGLTVTTNVTVAPGGTFTAGNGTLTTHTLGIGGTNTTAVAGNLVNNGTFDLNTTAGVTTTFFGSLDGSISGSGGTPDFWAIVVNKGTTQTGATLDVAVPITMNAPTASGTRLTITNGTFKMSSASTLTPWFGSQTICAANGRLWLNNAGATMTAVGVGTGTGAGAPTVTGELRIDAGTWGYGSGNNTLTFTTGSGILRMSGGTLNMFGAITFGSSITTQFIMSGGNINVDPQAANSLATGTALFTLGASTSTNWTGGTVTIVDPHSAAGGTAFSNTSATNKIITGGKLRIGDGTSTTSGGAISTTSGFGITAAGGVWDLEIDNRQDAADSRMARTTGTVVVLNQLEVKANGYLFLGSGTTGQLFAVVGNSINSGTIAGTQPTGAQILGTFYMAGVGPQTVSGNGAFTNINTLSIDNSGTSLAPGDFEFVETAAASLAETADKGAVAEMSRAFRRNGSASLSPSLSTVTLANTSPFAVNRVNAFTGVLNPGSNFTIGRAASIPIVQIGAGAEVPAGSFTTVPTFNNAAGPSTYIYNIATGSHTTGAYNEMPAGPQTLTQLLINDGDGLTLDRAITLNSFLTLTLGTITTTSSNILTIASSFVAPPSGSATSFVNGPLAIQVNTANDTVRTFGIGRGTGWRPLVLNAFNSGGVLRTYTAEVINGPTGGTFNPPFSGLNPTRYYRLQNTANILSSTFATVQLSYGVDDTIGVPALAQIGQASASNGLYSALGGTTQTTPTTGIRSTSAITPGSDFFVIGRVAPLVPLSGDYTVGVGGAYTTITAAVSDLNGRGVSGNVRFLLTDVTYPSESFPITINIFSDSLPTASRTVTFRPNTGVTATVSGSSTSSIFKLGPGRASYIIFDGSNNGTSSRDWTISNTSTSAATAAIWISSGGTGLGSSNNVVKNLNLSCGVTQNTATTETFGIISSGATISTSTDGTENNNNTYTNNAITKARWGIWLRGAAASLNNNTMVNNNIVGPAGFGPDQIGKGGIVLQNQNAATVTQNEVRFVGGDLANTSSGSDRVGIGLGAGDGWPVATATTITNSSVTRNLVHDVIDERTFSAIGIGVAGSGSPSSNTVANNVIYGVRANGTVGDQGAGIVIVSGAGDRVVFNSIRMNGDLDPTGASTASVSAAGIRITSTTPSNLLLEDNAISVDITSNTATLKHYAIVAPSTAYAWGTGASNNNDYFVNGSNTQMVLGGIGTSVPYTDVTTLVAWQTQFTPNQDANSIAVDPLFVSDTDLRPFVGSPLLGAGVTVGGITIDFLGVSRGSPPSIGAYEQGVSANMTYTSSTTTQTNTSPVFTGTNNQQIIGLQVVTSGTSNPINATRFRLNTTGTTATSDIANARMWYTGTSNIFATTTPFGGTVGSPSGSFLFNGSQALVAGTNYFWLTYDILPGAVPGHVVDAESESLYVGGTGYVPSITAPTGNRTITGIAVIVTRPDSLVKTLASNSIATDTVVIKNNGNVPLNWSISDENADHAMTGPSTLRYHLPGPELPKGSENSNLGNPITDGSGGPDAFGYRWIDSDSLGGGVTFSWIDMSITGTRVDTSQFVPTGTFARTDEGYLPVVLPFPFPYYGVSKDTLFIGTNGNVMFQRPAGNIFTNAAFPTAGGGIDEHIGVWWDDLNLNGSTSGKIFYGVSGSDFVVHFDSIGLFSTPNTPNYTFEVILSPDGTIKTQYLNMAMNGGTLTSSSIGIENATGTVGLTVVHNAAYMHNNLAIRFFLPDAPWLSENPISGSVNPGDSTKVAVTFNSTGLVDGTYNAVLKIASNDPITPLRNIPVHMTVGGSSTVTLNVPLGANWNIVSLPVGDPIPNDSVRRVFENSVNAYAYAFVNNQYVQRFTLSKGPGYWIKSSTSYTQAITGTPVDSLTIPVVNNWNMIGSISSSIDTSSARVTPNPAGLRASVFYQFNISPPLGYQAATTIVPGRGYWVKANGAGTFHMHIVGVPRAGKTEEPAVTQGKTLDDLHTLTIEDATGGSQTLYFGADGAGEIPVLMYEMPPLPPAGMFDARFSTATGGYLVQTHPAEVSTAMEMPIAIQTESYPVTVRWKINGTAASYELSDGAGGVQTLRGEGTMRIGGSNSHLTLRVTGSGTLLPKEYALYQNYPNPFNPTTTIKYALPVDSKVTVEMYNIIGQRVRTLVSTEQAAGYYLTEWNGTNDAGAQLASGMYFMRMSAEGTNGKTFTDVRKTMMLK